MNRSAEILAELTSTLEAAAEAVSAPNWSPEITSKVIKARVVFFDGRGTERCKCNELEEILTARCCKCNERLYRVVDGELIEDTSDGEFCSRCAHE
jgi:hypothetical protein